MKERQHKDDGLIVKTLYANSTTSGDGRSISEGEREYSELRIKVGGGLMATKEQMERYYEKLDRRRRKREKRDSGQE